MSKRLKIIILAIVTSVLTGCASNSAAIEKSPCAGCNFEKLPTHQA